LVVWTVSFVLDDILLPGGRKFVLADLGILAVWMLLAMVLHFWVQRVDKPKPKSHRPVTIRRVMLFYPFHRPAARIVRILFYLWILMMVVEAVGKFLDDPNSIPGASIRVVAYLGYAAAIRYWAVSLERRHTSSEVSGATSSTGTADEPRAGVAPAGSA
jgi:hypothetical protein